MFIQTIEDIITEINIERLKSKEALKNSQLQSADLITKLETSQETSDSNERQSDSQLEGSCSRSCKRSCRRSCRSCMKLKIQKTSTHVTQQVTQKIQRKKWNRTEEQLFCTLIGKFGSDFTFLQNKFPNKTRKQLKKKYQQIHRNERCLSAIKSVQSQVIREKRKMFFDKEIMDFDGTIQSGDDNEQTDSRIHAIRIHQQIDQESTNL